MLLQSTRRVLWQAFERLGDPMPVVGWVAVVVGLGATGRSFFDPLVAGGTAAWIVVSTAREVRGSRDELIWPEKLVCGHPERH